VLNVAPHELVERQLGSQHQQVVIQLDPALVEVLPKARPLPLRGAFEQPPRCLLDQRQGRQAVDGIGPLPSERLARERHLAKISRIEEASQEKHDVGVEKRGYHGGNLLPLHGIAGAGHRCGCLSAEKSLVGAARVALVACQSPAPDSAVRRVEATTDRKITGTRNSQALEAANFFRARSSRQG
ncbi:hypothetical protein THAOC_05513, partial [Thalassiosira oceanica]